MTEKLIAKFQDVKPAKTQDQTLSFNIPPEKITAICQFLKDSGYRTLLNLTASHHQDYFKVIYHLLSFKENKRIALIAEIKKEIDSLAAIFPPANWYEREVYDLFGINFKNHPDLRRIMLPDDWQGHPLRKDYQDKDVIKLPGPF